MNCLPIGLLESPAFKEKVFFVLDASGYFEAVFCTPFSNPSCFHEGRNVSNNKRIKSLYLVVILFAEVAFVREKIWQHCIHRAVNSLPSSAPALNAVTIMESRACA